MRFGYYERLSPARQRIYRRSDDIGVLGMPAGLDLGEAVVRIEAALHADDRARVQHECGKLIDALAGGYHVPRVRVRVLARRPADDYGELHGLYEPEDGRALPRITAW